MNTTTKTPLILFACALAWGCGGEPEMREVITTCGVTRGDDGATFTCPDGSSAVVRDGYPGADGQGRVVLATAVSEIEDSVDCPGGGIAVTVGPDEDGDGSPDPDTAQTEEVCGGPAGADGLRALFTRRDVPVGDECASGGFVVDVAFDANGDAVADPEEVSESFPFCDLVCPNDSYYDEASNLCHPGVVISLTGVVEMIFNASDFPGALVEGDLARVRLAYDPQSSAPDALYAHVGDSWFAHRVLSSGNRYDARSEQNPPRDTAAWSFFSELESDDTTDLSQLTLQFDALFGSFFNVDTPPRVLNPFELRNAPNARFIVSASRNSALVRLDVSSLTTLDYLADDLQEAP